MKHSEKHSENKKVKISNILLFILLIAAIVLIVFICIKFNERNKNEEAVKAVVAEIENIPVTDEEETIQYIDYEGYQVIGTIKINKIGIEYPILVESTVDSLEKSISRVGNGKVNEIGNLTLAGHNYIDGTMFGNIDKLEKGDTFKILDLHGNEVTYSIFDIFVTDPNDVSVLNAREEGKKEVTLITCTNGNKNRLIIKAREI